MSYTITEQTLPLEMPGETAPVDLTATREHTLRWNPRVGYARLDKLDDSARDAWYADVLRGRMASLDMALADGMDDNAVRAYALAVAGWALNIASKATTYDVLSFEESNERAYLQHRLIRDAGAITTMAADPHPGDKVEITWGSLEGGC